MPSMRIRLTLLIYPTVRSYWGEYTMLIYDLQQIVNV